MGIHIKIRKTREYKDLHEYEIIHDDNTMFVRLIPSLKQMIFYCDKEFRQPFLYWHVDHPSYQNKSLKECFEPNINADMIDGMALVRAYIKFTNALRDNIFPQYMDHCC